MNSRVQILRPATKAAALPAQPTGLGGFDRASEHNPEPLGGLGHHFSHIRVSDSVPASIKDARPVARHGDMDGQAADRAGRGVEPNHPRAPSTAPGRRPGVRLGHGEPKAERERTSVTLGPDDEQQELEQPNAIAEPDEQRTEVKADITRSSSPLSHGRFGARTEISARAAMWGRHPPEPLQEDAPADYAIARVQKVFWGAAQRSGHAEHGGDEVIVSPTSKSMLFVEATGGATGLLGATSRPSGYKAPAFDLNMVDKGVSFGAAGPSLGLKSKPQWFALPKQTTKADEGNNFSFAVGAGLQKSGATSGGKPLFFSLSAAIAKRNLALESEHPDDHRLAFKMSLQHAEDVLQNHVHGKTFGPKSTEAAAKQMVLDAITANLTHAQLGNDQTKWGDKYKMLSAKTGGRDSKAWHTFGTTLMAHKDAKGTVVKFVATVTQGTTKLVPSKDVVKY